MASRFLLAMDTNHHGTSFFPHILEYTGLFILKQSPHWSFFFSLVIHWLHVSQQAPSLVHSWEEIAKSWNRKKQLAPWNKCLTVRVSQQGGEQQPQQQHWQQIPELGQEEGCSQTPEPEYPSCWVVRIALGIVGSTWNSFPKWFLDVVCELTQIKGLGTIAGLFAVIAFWWVRV